MSNSTRIWRLLAASAMVGSAMAALAGCGVQNSHVAVGLRAGAPARVGEVFTGSAPGGARRVGAGREPARAGGASARGTLSLITEPQDGIAPVLRLIGGARRSVEMTMYEMEDRRVERALAERARAGARVRVLLQRGVRGAAEAIRYLRGNGVEARYAPSRFALTHQKSVEVDREAAMIMTFNLTPRYYEADRDFAVLDRRRSDVAAIEGVFQGDWEQAGGQGQRRDRSEVGLGSRSGIRLGSRSEDPHARDGSGDLLWSPGAQGRLLTLIDGAKRTLQVEAEEMDDPTVTAALCSAAERGVSVEVTMTYEASWRAAFARLSRCGAHVRTYPYSAALYIHAKAILADGRVAFVGSENLSRESLQYNRELGIVTRSKAVVDPLRNTMAGDFDGAAQVRGRGETGRATR